MPIVELPDGREVEFPDGMSQDQMSQAIQKNFPEFAPKAQPSDRTWGQAATDTAKQLGEGVNTIIGAVPNLIAPESRAAKFFNDNADYWRGEQSAPLKAKIARADQAISKAGEEGIIAQVVEAARQYSDDPAMAARFVTTNLPSMIPGIGAAKLAQAAALARGATAIKAAGIATTAAGGVNAILNAGGARGEAYEDIKRAAKAKGFSDAEAEQRAISGSRLPAAVGAATGFISGKTGLEGALAGKVGASTAARRAGASFVTEMAGEQLEEVAPKIATNWQASEYDGRGMGQDVGRTMVETAIGAGPGAVVGGISAARHRQAPSLADPAPPAAPTPEPAPAPAPAAPRADVGDILGAGSVDDAIAAAQNFVRRPIAGDTPTASDLDALEDTYADNAAGGTAGIPGDAPGAVLGGGEVLAAPEPGGALGSEAAAQLAAVGAPAAGGPVANDGEGLLPAGSATDAQPALTDIGNPTSAAIPAQAGTEDAADWHAFPPETGTLNVPRAEMPQVRAEHRGALTQFLAARGIPHQQVEVDAAELKPTQAEFSLSKVRAAQDYQGGNRSILVSSDGHVLDGHHQWLAAVEAGQPVKAIVLDAPIAQLLDAVREFPSAGVDTASAPVQTIAQDAKRQPLNLVRMSNAKDFDWNRAKPNGTYASIADDPTKFTSPFAGDYKDGQRHDLQYTPNNPLEVGALSVRHPRFGKFGSGDASAGVKALHAMLPQAEFDAALTMSKEAVQAEIARRFPGVDTSKAVDAYEALEIWGAQEAKKRGHDVIVARDEAMPQFSEAVLLDGVGEQAPAKRPGQDKLDAAARKSQRQEEAVKLAAQNIEARKGKQDQRSSIERETTDPSSWIIRNKKTGEVIAETYDKRKVEALNYEKYEAVPALQHLQEINMPGTTAHAVARGEKPPKKPKTGGQTSRERLQTENPFLHFLADLGLQIDERSDTGGQDRKNRMIPGFGPVYRRNGKRLDELAALAVEAGFLTQQDIDAADDTGGTRKLAEMIERAVHGNEVIQRAASPEAAAPSADDRLLEEAARLGLDVTGMDADQVYDAVATAHADEFSNNEARALADRADEADIDLDAGTNSNLENDEELDAIFGPQSRGAGKRTGETEKGAAAPARGRAEETARASQSTREKLKIVAGRLGIKVNEVGGGFNAGHGMVEIPAEDQQVEGALSPEHVFAHELGHAIISKRGLSFNRMPISYMRDSISNWDDLVAASKDYRPAVWNHANDRIRKHARKPNEVIADAFGSVLIGQRPLSMLTPMMEKYGINEGDMGVREWGDVSGENLLTSYSAADVVAREQAKEEVGKRLQADKTKLESAAKKEAERRDVAARMDASADNFQLGQSADDALAGQEGLRFSVAAEDDARDIPITFMRSMQVPVETWNRTESRFETKDMRADQALDQVREDIDTYQRMIACMKG